MADGGCELKEEIEALEAIYIHELELIKDDRDKVSGIILQLHPATGDREDKKFVCMTLQLDLPENYPHEVPAVMIRNPRGIGDEEIQSLLEDMKQLANDRVGGPMLYELIELAKESLTVGNIPHCLCMICLEHFYEGERFTKTECYHYFHKSCLARYIQHFLSNNEETETKPLTLHMNQEERKVQCPVCRNEIEFEEDSLTFSPVEDRLFFKPNEEMRQLQAEMAERLEKQRAAGGLIDVDAEKNKFLLKNDDVVQLPARLVEEVKDRKNSPRDRRGNDKFCLRRNRDGHDRNDRRQNWRNKDEFRTGGENAKRYSDWPNLGFIRGKGRGKVLDDRNGAKPKQSNNKNSKKEIGNCENRKNIDDELEERVDPQTAGKEAKIVDDGLDENVSNLEKCGSESEREIIPGKEKDEEMNKLRYDEKINSKHKQYSNKTENDSEKTENEICSSSSQSITPSKEDANIADIDATATVTDPGININPQTGNSKGVHYNEKPKGRGGFGRPSDERENLDRPHPVGDKPNNGAYNQDKREKSDEKSYMNDNRSNRDHKYQSRYENENKGQRGAYERKKNYERYQKSSHQRNNDGRYGKYNDTRRDDRFYKAHGRHRIDKDSEYSSDHKDHHMQDKCHLRNKFDDKYSKNPENCDKNSCDNIESSDVNKHHESSLKTNSYTKESQKTDSDRRQFKTERISNEQESWESELFKDSEMSDEKISTFKKDNAEPSKEKKKPEFDRQDQRRGGFGKPKSARKGQDNKERRKFENKRSSNEQESWESELLKDSEMTSEKSSTLIEDGGEFGKKQQTKLSDEEKKKTETDRPDPRRGGFGKPKSGKKSHDYKEKKNFKMEKSSHEQESWESELFKDSEMTSEKSSTLKKDGRKSVGEQQGKLSDEEKKKPETERPDKRRGGFGRPKSGRNSHYKEERSYNSDWVEKGVTKDYSYKTILKDNIEKPQRRDYIDENDTHGREKSRKEFKYVDKHYRPYSGGEKRHGGYRNDNRRGGFKNEKQYDVKHEKQYDVKHEKQYDVKNEKQYDVKNEKQYAVKNEKQYDVKNEKQYDVKNEKQYAVKNEKQYDVRHNSYGKEERTYPKSKETGRNKDNDCDNVKDGKMSTEPFTNLDSGMSFSRAGRDKRTDITSDKTAEKTDDQIKQNCDENTKKAAVKPSHPPGFRVGPPPGFRQETKKSETIKPPPGF